MRLGIFVPQGWRMDLVGIAAEQQWGVMLDLAQRADAEEGWESLWVYDHVHTVPEPSEEACHEAWTLMAALAATTGRIRLGQMWTTGSATLDGEHYQVDGALCFPRPLQGSTAGFGGSGRNGIPMWVAGGGEHKTLRIAAEYADATNFDGSPEGFERKSEILREHCEQVGTDFDAIVRSANYNVVIGRDEAEVEERLDGIRARFEQAGLTPAKAQEQVDGLRTQPAVGTAEQITEVLAGMQERGMTYAITYFAEAAYDTSGIELFEDEVIPALRG